MSGPIAVAGIATAAAIVAAAVLPSALGTNTAPGKRSATTSRAALRRPAVRLSIVAMAAAHVAMVSVMLMTPVQVHHHGHGLGVIGMILSAHMIGMFALAPLSGRIADRCGGRTAIGAGVAVLLMAATLAASLPTSDELGIPIALFLLGYGWNLCFVGGSSVLARDLPEETRVPLQGTIDAMIWGTAAVASLSAGTVFGIGGYQSLAVLAGLVALVPGGLLLRRRADVT